MDMLSLFRRKAGRADSPAADAPDAVHVARTRARRRLVGAAVLVAAGIVVFPVLFETQPRPIPIDLPIEIPRKDGAPPLPAPGARPEPRATGPQPEADARHAAHADATAADDPVITETPADAGREVAPPPRPALTATPPRPKTQPAALLASAPASAPAKRAMAAASKPVNVNKAAASKPVDTRAAASKPASVKPAASKPADARPVASRSADAERAQALLEGRAPAGKAIDAPAAASAGGRFAVQVGAFSEDSAAREARSKLERLGLKSYLQVTDTPGGKRIRVRVGPYASRDEAERATAKIKSSALPAVIVGL